MYTQAYSKIEQNLKNVDYIGTYCNINSYHYSAIIIHIHLSLLSSLCIKYLFYYPCLKSIFNDVEGTVYIYI